MYCANCGAKLNEDEKFCRNCGTQMDSSSAQNASQTAGQGTEPLLTQQPAQQIPTPNAQSVAPPAETINRKYGFKKIIIRNRNCNCGNFCDWQHRRKQF